MRHFDVIYQKHLDKVLRFATRRVGRPDIAEELTADAFLQLYLHWDAIDVDRLPAWLFTVVTNRAVDYFRHEASEKRFLNSTERLATCHALEDTLLFDSRALNGLHRTCLRLRYIHEMSVDDIADHVGSTPVRVKGHLQYARQILRRQLSGKT